MTNKYIRHIYTKVAAAAIVLFAGSCADYDLEYTVPGEGSADVTLNLSYNTFESKGGVSRAAAGDAISEIYDVSVVTFSTAGSLIDIKYFEKGNGLEVSNSSHRPSDTSYDDDVVRQASVPVTLPYGSYHIYAVANMGAPDSWAKGLSTEDEFRSIRFDWVTDISQNNQMCGIVTADADKVITNRQPEAVTISKTTSELHSWLQRAVSKATIAFDATELNHSIYIYIMSAQVRDIPMSCTMIDKNVPQTPAGRSDNLSTGECLTQGEVISYLNTPGKFESSRVILANGTPFGGLNTEDSLDPGKNVHTTTEESLYFYENMQGTHPDKHLYNNFPQKDNVEYGTYIEVKAYYENNSSTNPSRGNITYRYMLGMNDTDDFNAQRNTHYKVTLKFKGDANNPDWHIEYTRPTVPTVEVPTPLRISYLYNQRLDVPIVCYYNDENYYVKSVKAEIIENPYTHSEHQYSNLTGVSFGGKTYNWTDPKYGFLSLNSHESQTTIDMTSSTAYVGSVNMTSFPSGSYDNDVKGMKLTLPVYTRPLNLMVPNSGTLTDLGFSGNNHFTHRERKAKIRVSVVFGSLANSSYTTTSTTDVEILQVKRVVNPKGCWRPSNSTKKMTFTIMESEQDATNINSINESEVSYTPIRSKGPWTARIYTEPYNGGSLKPGADWIEISPKGANKWRKGPDATVTGATNSIVEFDYRPTSTIAEGQTRFGVIEVLYHDNQCRHLIFVSQGYGTVKMGSNDWMMGNLYSNGTEVDNPLLEGSMFKYGNAEYGIRARNNYSMDNEDRGAGPFKDTESVNLYWVKHTYSGGKFSTAVDNHAAKYGSIKADLANGFNQTSLTKNSKGSGTYRVATYQDFKELLDTDRFGTLFGVLYGEESSDTKTSKADRYTDKGDQSGMRGCFIYDRATGNHLFLPIGNTGNGRRKAYYDDGASKRKGVLKYANRDALMPENVAKPRPLMYDIYRKPGALYWFQSFVTEGSTKHYALDINYFTYLVNVFDTQILYYYGSSTDKKYTQFKGSGYARPSSTWADENSDAAFVRRIKVN